MIPAKLVLKTGEIFEGMVSNWVQNITFGEIVFNTGMVGYIEVITDPSYRGQIVCFTYPIVGNYGIPNKHYWESENIQVSGIIVSELATFSTRTKYSLKKLCKKHNIPILYNVDTRALAQFIRKNGVLPGAIIIDNTIPKNYPYLNNLNLVSDVTVSNPILYGNGHKKVIVVDFGIKYNILRSLSMYPQLTLKRVPYDYDYTQEMYDGILLSNGPGNPNIDTKPINYLKTSMLKYPNKPIFGICFGLQIMGIAIGAKIYKLKFGHRAQNHPCLLEGTNKSYLTSQNHGFAIDEQTIPNNWKVWFRHLNDNTIQGIKHNTLPYSSVQFHPEARPGPMDTSWLFDRFINQL